MFLAFVLLSVVLIIGLFVLFRKLRFLQGRLDKLVLEHNGLENRVLMLAVRTNSTPPVSASSSDNTRVPKPAHTEMRRLLAAQVGGSPEQTVGLLPSSIVQQRQQVSFKTPAENMKLIQHNVDVGDVPNHIVNVYGACTTFPGEAPVINGLKIAESWSRGIGDMIDGHGNATDYLMYVMENGDKFFVRAANVIQAGAAGMLTATTVGHITGGTGRLAGIQGIVRLVGNFDLKEHCGGIQTDIEYSIGK